MNTKNTYRQAINSGLISAIITLNLTMLGMVELFEKRGLIVDVLSLGLVLLFLPTIVFSYLNAKKNEGETVATVAQGALIGLLTAMPVVFLAWAAQVYDLRQFFANVSPALFEMLSFGANSLFSSSLILVVSMVIVSMIVAAFYLIPEKFRSVIMTGLIGTLLVGMFAEILTERARTFFGREFAGLLFASKAMQPSFAAVVFFLFAVSKAFSNKREARGKEAFTKTLSFDADSSMRWVTVGITVVTLMVLPLLLGSYLSEVANNIGIYVLMGLGLNIVVGFSGLLDLGYVAFFAIGAYTMALLTSTTDYGLIDGNFWIALPIAIGIAALAGIVLGAPVLHMRGDYLAIVTLGFGEIIRILVLSDAMKPWLGGAQGILRIPKPSLFGTILKEPEQIYYVILAGVLLAWFVSVRLRDSRLGRQWMALREDEDVAEAMGINLVNTKLLAFSIGAAFSGLAGAIFASKLTSIYPHSFNLLISINVLSLIIVGGMGSLPGVVVGSIILVGLPELLREFAEYRMLMYGALLVVMMLVRPEGFVPAEVFRREQEADLDVLAAGD